MSSGHDSVFQRNRRLATYILDGDVGQNVLDELLPTGSAHAYEKSLWDYKWELPCLPEGRRPSEAEKSAFNIEMSQIVKDDIVPHSGFARCLAGVEAITCLAWTLVVFAALSVQFSSSSKEESQ